MIYRIHWSLQIKVRMVKEIPSIDFNPHDDLILDLLNGSWHVVLGALQRFSKTDGDAFNNKMNQPFAAI